MSGFSEKPRGRAAIPFWHEILNVFPDVQCERRFPWLKLPDREEASELEGEVRQSLIEHARVTQNEHRSKAKRKVTAELLKEKLSRPARPGLEFDFYVDSLQLAFEFDERQHFSSERAVSLETCYGRLSTGYDIDQWIKKCHQIQAVDPDPPHRDWQRAYRDAVRDIRASENGIRLVRVAFDDQLSDINLRAYLD